MFFPLIQTSNRNLKFFNDTHSDELEVIRISFNIHPKWVLDVDLHDKYLRKNSVSIFIWLTSIYLKWVISPFQPVWLCVTKTPFLNKWIFSRQSLHIWHLNILLSAVKAVTCYLLYLFEPSVTKNGLFTFSPFFLLRWVLLLSLCVKSLTKSLKWVPFTP